MGRSWLPGNSELSMVLLLFSLFAGERVYVKGLNRVWNSEISEFKIQDCVAIPVCIADLEQL